VWLERALLAVLTGLVILAVTLAVTHPSRVKLLAERAASLF
jgi:hypothetical protein